jgi:hypothetical protein
MTTRVLISLSIGLVTLLAGAAAAMEGTRREPPPPDEGLVRRVEERVEMLRKWRVLEALDPSEEVANRLLPLLSSADRRERDLSHQRERLIGELRRTLEGDARNEERLRGVLDALEVTERERCAARETLNRELAEMLNARQRARLVLALEEFHREVRDLIARVRRPPADHPGEPPIE